MSTDVRLIAWDTDGAVAVVEGIRCRIRRDSKGHVRWICATHGTHTAPHCHHLEQLAAHPAEPDRRRHA